MKGLNITLCLTNVECNEGDENYGRERTDASFKINFNSQQRAVGRITLKSVNIGTNLLPKYVLTATIEGIDSNYDSDDVVYHFYRKIEGRDTRFIEIEETDNNTYIDIPFNEGETNEYQITYKVIGVLPDGRTLDSSKNQAIHAYSLIEQGPNTDEKNNDSKKGIPLYTIILIIVAALFAILVGGFLIYKYFIKKSTFEKIAVDSVKQSQYTDVKPNKHKRSISNKEKIISYVESKQL